MDASTVVATCPKQAVLHWCEMQPACRGRMWQHLQVFWCVLSVLSMESESVGFGGDHGHVCSCVSLVGPLSDQRATTATCGCVTRGRGQGDGKGWEQGCSHT